MQLKQIEIKGFKSFADRTVLHFNNNMTGIVGPNGCGKSNTVDAIRWVLGEQKSRALRLDKMENIIFNGTKKRSPAGRAEVSLTFENTRNILPTDFGTITVTRILYRSGESEYLLNGVRCRLKDITTLFSDTGISSDSYAIIELGMIDEILNDNDDSRRRLFEQASGISKYKLRKKETMLKLKGTDEDLTRVEDLLHEIENNLKILEKQAKKTERYYKLREQYKELSLQLALLSVSGSQEELNTLQAAQEKAENERTALEAQLATQEATIEQHKTSTLTAEKTLADIQRIVNRHIAQVSDEESKKNMALQNIKFLTEKRETLRRQIDTAQKLAESLQKEVEFLRWDKQGEEKELEKTKTHLAELLQNLDDARRQNQIAKQQLEESQNQQKQTEKQLFDIEKENAVKVSQKEGLQREINETGLHLESRSQELAEMKQNRQQTDAERRQADDRLQEYMAEEEELREQIAVGERTLENARQKLANVNRSLDAANNEYKLTKSLVDSLEGFPDSVKFLKTQTNAENPNAVWNGNTLPLLLDIVNAPDEYKAAIENYLKPYLNYYIVDTYEQAAIAMQLLDKAQKGRAGFFVLNDLQNAQPTPKSAEDVLVSGESIVPALDRISADNRYIPLLNLLLHNAYLVDPQFVPTTAQLQTGAIFISSNGKQIRRKAEITGGSVGAFEGKRIGKRQQLEQLEKDIARLDKETADLKNSIDGQRLHLETQQKDLKSKVQLINFQRQEVSKLQNKITQFNARIENTERFMTDNADRETNLRQRIAQLDEALVGLSQSLSQLRAVHSTQTETILQADDAYQAANKALSEAAQRYNEQNIAYHKQQNRLNTIVQSAEFKEKQLKETNEQLLANALLSDEADTGFEDAQSQLSSAENILLELYAEKEKHNEALQKAEETYYKQRDHTAVLEKNLKETQKAKDQNTQHIYGLEQALNQLQLKLLSIRERLNIEFKVNLDEIMASEQPAPEMSKEDAENKTAKLKQQLDTYGEINPLAIEAYKEIKERYDFICAQREDLLTAKKSLLQTIKEIEQTATEKFLDAFHKIRENFIMVFRSLFTEEDQCDLVLLDPTDPLESAIDIIAKPKGKRPQSINQLSGGEKSLTALAMVFSLYLLKPAPFCILDEVDAPLDDTNVGKFTGIIRKFSDESQFIIVTHNKNTMAAVDVIYGVTMAEQGVSRVVPVDFGTLNAQM